MIQNNEFLENVINELNLTEEEKIEIINEKIMPITCKDDLYDFFEKYDITEKDMLESIFRNVDALDYDGENENCAFESEEKMKEAIAIISANFPLLKIYEQYILIKRVNGRGYEIEHPISYSYLDKNLIENYAGDNFTIDTASNFIAFYEEAYEDDLEEVAKEIAELKEIPKNNIVVMDNGCVENLGVEECNLKSIQIDNYELKVVHGLNIYF